MDDPDLRCREGHDLAFAFVATGLVTATLAIGASFDGLFMTYVMGRTFGFRTATALTLCGLWLVVLSAAAGVALGVVSRRRLPIRLLWAGGLCALLAGTVALGSVGYELAEFRRAWPLYFTMRAATDILLEAAYFTISAFQLAAIALLAGSALRPRAEQPENEARLPPSSLALACAICVALALIPRDLVLLLSSEASAPRALSFAILGWVILVLSIPGLVTAVARRRSPSLPSLTVALMGALIAGPVAFIAGGDWWPFSNVLITLEAVRHWSPATACVPVLGIATWRRWRASAIIAGSGRRIAPSHRAKGSPFTSRAPTRVMSILSA